MAGNARSGRLPTIVMPTADASDRPIKPKKLPKEVSAHWDFLCDGAEHLCERDGSTLLMACEVWVAWKRTAKLAEQTPDDFHLAGMANRYATQYQHSLKLLCLDPLGRVKAVRSQKREQKTKESKYFA